MAHPTIIVSSIPGLVKLRLNHFALSKSEEIGARMELSISGLLMKLKLAMKLDVTETPPDPMLVDT